MLSDDAAFFEQLPAYTFGLLGCSLSTTHQALAAIMAREPHHYELTSGEFDLTKVFARSDDGAFVRRRHSDFYLALLCSGPTPASTLVLSTVPDGWVTLCNAIALHVGTYRYMFELSDCVDANARNAFSYIDYSTEPPVERVVYAMKDPKWIFFQSGTPLCFEDVSHYEKRRIKERIDRVLLEKYCVKIGMNVRAPGIFKDQRVSLKFIHTWLLIRP
jgi:hypothetical protein